MDCFQVLLLNSSFAAPSRCRLLSSPSERVSSARGRPVQVDPIKPKLKPPGTKRLKLKCDILLPTSAFKSDLRRYNGGGGRYHFQRLAHHQGHGEPSAHLRSPRHRRFGGELETNLRRGRFAAADRRGRRGQAGSRGAQQASIFAGGGGHGGGGGGGRGLHSFTSQLNLSRFCHTSPCPRV